MIQAICNDCKELFMAAVILGLTECPNCGSQNTAVANYVDTSAPE